jgi:hypothetical protein
MEAYAARVGDVLEPPYSLQKITSIASVVL